MTSSLPVVMAIVSDPLRSGIVRNLAHPGGNVTGLSLMNAELNVKRLELLREIIPRLGTLAVLSNPDTPSHTQMVEQLQSAARELSIELVLLRTRSREQLTAAFSSISRARPQALYVLEGPFSMTNRDSIVHASSRIPIPTMHAEKADVQAGGLISYGVSYGDIFRRSAEYVGKILGGADPGDLPIEQPTKFELVVNLKTAKALGIVIPDSVLLRADEVVR